MLGEIRAALASLVPGIASFDVHLAGDEILLDFELSGGERMPARLVSSGTLRILALLTALQMRPRPYMLCIEEPENGIYPGRLRALLEVLREATTRDHEEETRERLEEARSENIETNQLPTQNPPYYSLPRRPRRPPRTPAAPPLHQPGPPQRRAGHARPYRWEARRGRGSLADGLAARNRGPPACGGERGVGVIYLRAGLYAEGPTDYQFLRPLLDRLLNELAARALPAFRAFEADLIEAIQQVARSQGHRP